MILWWLFILTDVYILYLMSRTCISHLLHVWRVSKALEVDLTGE